MQLHRPSAPLIESLMLDYAEIGRYLGYGKARPEDIDLRGIDAVFSELKKKCRPLAAWDLYPLTFPGEDLLALRDLRIKSHSLKLALRGCDGAVMLAATLGFVPDQMIARAKIASVSRALIIQACSAALIEAYLDAFTEELKTDPLFSGASFRSRFSPGYGDLPLELQKEILPRLDAQKTLGITLGDSLLMMPSKSVTAFIGVSHAGLRS